MRVPMCLLVLPLSAALAACSAPPPDEQEVEQAQAQQAAAQAAAPEPDAAPQPPPIGSCDATQVQSLVGQALSDASRDQARQDSGAKQVRVLKQGQPVTMEYLGDRLSIEVDADGRVGAVRCG